MGTKHSSVSHTRFSRFRSGTVVLAVLTLVGCDSSPTTPSSAAVRASGTEAAEAVRGALLLRDDFNGAVLDSTKWYVPQGCGTFIYLSRTQIRAGAPPLANGVLCLPVDTYNPTAQVPGDSFLGSEVRSRQTFRNVSVRGRARLRRNAPAGIVGSIFLYGLQGTPCMASGRDEIDFELLSNDSTAGIRRAWTNIFNNADFDQPGAFAPVSLVGRLTGFHEYEVRWYADRVEWWIDGVRRRLERNNVPDQPLEVRLNSWVPGPIFAEAFSGALHPVATPAANETFCYEVDFVEVRALN